MLLDRRQTVQFAGWYSRDGGFEDESVGLRGLGRYRFDDYAGQRGQRSGTGGRVGS